MSAFSKLPLITVNAPALAFGEDKMTTYFACCKSLPLLQIDAKKSGLALCLMSVLSSLIVIPLLKGGKM